MINAIRNSINRQLRRRIVKGCQESDTIPNEYRSALVFSPHFDDETLGCGGAIIKKLLAGVRVGIVFMTDGATSHRTFFSADNLRKLRKTEGENAARFLGVNSDDVMFLNYEEGRLCEQKVGAERRVLHLIKEYDPDEIYVPHTKEPDLWSMDHLATSRIVKKAAGMLPGIRAIYEYPIWYWFHWPWVGIDIRERFYTKVILKNTLVYRFGVRSLSDFNYCNYVADVLSQKRSALEQHRTQMTQLVEDDRWKTLPDIAKGQFLSCFFTDYEYFYRYQTNLEGVGY